MWWGNSVGPVEIILTVVGCASGRIVSYQKCLAHLKLYRLSTAGHEKITPVIPVADRYGLMVA